MALRWILDNPAVTCVIPGGKNPRQVEENCAASALPALSSEVQQRIRKIYEQRIKAHVHHRW
jgi:aryl-alcohol dehydrogenase-like predicted oxidoreductase